MEGDQQHVEGRTSILNAACSSICIRYWVSLHSNIKTPIQSLETWIEC